MKAGDKIYLAVDDRISSCEIVGFRAICTELKSGNHAIAAARFNQGLFYGYGYDKETRYLFLSKLWHYYVAVLCEKIRLKLPQRVARFIKLEK